MPHALFIGSTWVGESLVGSAAFIYTASGAVTFTGIGQEHVLVNHTSSGSIAFSGHAPLEGKRSTAGSVTFSGQLGKQYTRTYGGFLAFSGAAAGNFSGSISVRSASGGIAFEGVGQGFKSKEYNTSLTDSFYVGNTYIGVMQVGASKSVNSIVFTGVAFKQAQSTKVAAGVIDYSTNTAPVSRLRVVVGNSGLVFTGAAVFQKTVRSNIWIVKDAFINGANEGGSSIWEGDALLDAATAPVIPVAVVATNGGSDNIWGTA